MGLEFAILDEIQALRTPWGDVIMPFVTSLADGGAVWLLGTAGLLAHKKTRKTGAVMLTGLVIQAVLCNFVLKPVTARIRPYDVNHAIKLLIDPLRDYSFPSGHTAASFAAAFGLFYRDMRKLFWPAVILASMIAFSRMYLYVHYPTDVLAGIGIGIGSAWSGEKFLNYLIRKKEDKD